MKTVSGAPSAGRTVTHPAGAGVVRGSGQYAGSGKGGTEVKGTATGDPMPPAFRKLNNADPGSKL